MGAIGRHLNAVALVGAVAGTRLRAPVVLADVGDDLAADVASTDATPDAVCANNADPDSSKLATTTPHITKRNTLLSQIAGADRAGHVHSMWGKLRPAQHDREWRKRSAFAT